MMNKVSPFYVQFRSDLLHSNMPINSMFDRRCNRYLPECNYSQSVESLPNYYDECNYQPSRTASERGASILFVIEKHFRMVAKVYDARTHMSHGDITSWCHGHLNDCLMSKCIFVCCKRISR